MATTKVSTKLLETVGVAEGGTGATSAGAARTSLGLVIGTNVLAPNGSGSSLTGIATGATSQEATNIMLNAFRIAVAGGLSVQNMVDGVVDEFEDETGIDTSTSTNENYNTTSDFYGNRGTTVTVDASSQTYTASNSRSGNQPNLAFDSDLGTFWASTDQASPQWIKIQFGSTNTIQRYTWYYTDVSSSMPVTEMHLEGSNDDSSWTTLVNQTGLTVVINTLYTANFTNTTAYAYYRVTKTHTGGNNSHQLAEVTLVTVFDTIDMALFSNASTALAAPDDANIVIWQEDVDSVTLNTDLKAYASRNGGTTYTQLTLSEVANLTTGRILTGAVDISGQSSGTAMKYKIETFNTKEQKIHAVALQWS